MSHPVLAVTGEIETPSTFSFADLAAFPAAEQVPNVSRFQPARKGDGVTLEAILARVKPKAAARYLTLHATADDFHASVPLAAIRGEAIVVYRLDGQPLPEKNGGPFRFLIKDPAACHTDELDDCANVKFVDRMELTAGKGRDNRPENDEDHAKLHGAGRQGNGAPGG